MLNFTPSLSRIRAKLAPLPPLLDQAAEVIELEPGSTTEVPPAVEPLLGLTPVTVGAVPL